MKMITKTFLKPAHYGFSATEWLIDERLHDAYSCFIKPFKTMISSGAEMMAECYTPENFRVAAVRKTPITFCVTLPARYWK